MNKSDQPVETALDTIFRIDLIAETPAPDGSDAVWQQYVISQGTNKIVGKRVGTRAVVVTQIEEMVARMNERLGKVKAKAK